MRLAHLSDVHVFDGAGVSPWRYFNKRVTGLANLLGSRKDAHPQAFLIEAVRELAAAEDIAHVVITGDLTNLSLQSEFARAREILAPLIALGKLSVIPGNHDIYTRGSARAKRFEGVFGDLMWTEPEDDATYPWVKRVGDVSLIGFCSAFPTPPLFAHGRVSTEQLSRLQRLAEAGTFEGTFPVALTHHNLHPRSWRKNRMHGCQNRDAFIAACRGAGVRMILHGHTHVAHRFSADGVDIVGCGSSTWRSHDPSHTGRYNVYDIEGGALVGTEVRIWQFDRSRFAAA